MRVLRSFNIKLSGVRVSNISVAVIKFTLIVNTNRAAMQFFLYNDKIILLSQALQCKIGITKLGPAGYANKVPHKKDTFLCRFSFTECVFG